MDRSMALFLVSNEAPSTPRNKNDDANYKQQFRPQKTFEHRKKNAKNYRSFSTCYVPTALAATMLFVFQARRSPRWH
jgi:hypothetical protein